MQKINDLNSTSQSWEELDPNFRNYLIEQFTNPLLEKGFTLITYGMMGDTGHFTHTLIFTFTGESYPRDLNEFISNLMTDDDSQPYSNYTLYFGTLFININGFC